MVNKLIVALDFAEQKSALALVDKLDPQQCGLKIGSEMFTLFGTDFVKKLIDLDFKVFLDLKFHDIPTTVAKACSACSELGVWMITLHACGGLAMLEAAKKAINDYGDEAPLLMAVTVLTSMKNDDLPLIGVVSSVENQVQRLASLACQAEMDGLVCSAFEVPLIKANYGSSLLTVTPGIRLASDETHDQLRVMTPYQAITVGSDFLVIGRSITQDKAPEKKVQEVFQQIDEATRISSF